MKVNRPYRGANRKKWWVRWSNEPGDRCKRSFDRHADAEHFISVETARIREVEEGHAVAHPGDEEDDAGGLKLIHRAA